MDDRQKNLAPDRGIAPRQAGPKPAVQLLHLSGIKTGPHGRICTCTPLLTPASETGASAVPPRGEIGRAGGTRTPDIMHPMHAP